MPTSHWLDQYASACYDWQEVKHDGQLSFHRRMGLIEQAFDADGRYFEGRADMLLQLDISLRSHLDIAATHRHIELAYACLRTRYVLLQAKAPDVLPAWARSPEPLHFLIDVPTTLGMAVDEARSQLVFVQGRSMAGDALSFYNSALNCKRLVDAASSLSRLYVLPPDPAGKMTLFLVTGHQVGDGMAMGEWIADLVRLLNVPDTALENELTTAIQPGNMSARLPLPQEALYPSITGSRARQRWFWLLTRILRHVRKPLPAGFANPLLKKIPNTSARVEAQWTKVLDYSPRPPLDSAISRSRSSRASTRRLTRICRDADVSIGSGCFALAALIMMEFYEHTQPDVPLSMRRPFITGFPLNPRPFLRGNPAANSLMLAFSDGIMLPFLPSHLDLEGRLRLLAKQAQRQLAVYQKRVKPSATRIAVEDMGSRGAGRMLAIQYLGSIERFAAMSPNGALSSPQGAYPMRPNATRQTCGVSSTGRGRPMASMTKYENQDFVATPIDFYAGVRSREGEFLIGVGGGEAGLSANVSLDASAMDPDLVAAWKHRFETILEDDQRSML